MIDPREDDERNLLRFAQPASSTVVVVVGVVFIVVVVGL
jgi:hypothetical protein